MKPVIMKLPYLIRPTLMPASRAPSRFPPAEIVYRPHRVRVSTTWKIRTRTTAQTNGAHYHGLPEPPSHLPALRTAGGVGDGSACEKVRAIPSMINPVPIVVMNEGRPSVTVRKPFTQPPT